MPLVNIRNKNTEATIDSFGAELKSFSKNGKNVIWEIDTDYWNKTSPILFPIVGQLKINAYIHNWKTYTLNRHGFARDCEFEVVLQKENEVVFLLRASEASLKNYPFHFELEIKYTLIDCRLKIDFKVSNIANDKMYFSIGAHPAFKITKPIENYSLQFNNSSELLVSQLENGLLNETRSNIKLLNNTLKLSNSLFEKDAIVLQDFESTSVRLLDNEKPIIALHFADFKDFGIWSKPNAAFICLEPWLGHADILNTNSILENKKGIIQLNSEETFLCSYSIEIL